MPNSQQPPVSPFPSEAFKEVPTKKVGFVALLGRPNSGKSTFLNTLLEEKVSIVSPRPQTTQKTVRGIYNSPSAQIVFLDLAGIHTVYDEFNRAVNTHALKSLKSADVVVRFVDSFREYGEEDARIDEIVRTLKKPIVTVLSRADLCTDREALLERFPSGLFLSSRNKDGFSEVIAAAAQYLPV